jgi:RHS repeat-associated protein
MSTANREMAMNLIRQILLWVVLLCAAGAGLAQTREIVVYLHPDITGSPVMATDAAGNVIWKERYAPYGERQVKVDDGRNSLWYTGKSQDPDTGLSYFGARWYDPVLGRFQGVDPSSFNEINPQTFNRYAYGNNNPYKYKDPNGKVAETIIDVVSLALSIAAYRQEPSVLNALGLAYDAVAVAVPGLPGGVGILRQAGKTASGVVVSGLAADAKFAQKTFNPMFSAEGKFAGKSVDDVAAALRSGSMKPSEIPIDYVVRDGQTLILNTRSSQALEAAGIPRSQWNAVNRTGQDFYEGLLNGQLGRNPGGPFDAVRRSGLD